MRIPVLICNLEDIHLCFPYMKTVFITGASRGIGAATAKLFLERNFRVIGTSRSGIIPIEHSNFIPIKMDLLDPKSILQLVESLDSTIRVDLLINNAAIILDADLNEPDIGMIRKTFEADVLGTIQLTEALMPRMSLQARIINVSSQCGVVSDLPDDETAIGYRMAKAALNMYTRSLGLRLQTTEMIVAAVDPGWVQTDMGNAVATEADKPDRTPEEAAQDIYQLATTVIENGCFWRFGKKRTW
jgi:NAD(P)-dependent dehydrogenase (short-subunit alcohol dehydrogenase family)